jgi:FkbM family methyltransferase
MTGWFERQCSSLRSPDAILHIGAGRGAELAVYRDFDAARILLVEPQADLAARLRVEASAMPNVRVLQLAVAKESGNAELQLLSVEGFSSLKQAVGLRELFPGLIANGVAMVETLSLCDLIAGQSLEATDDNWLIIDAPGIESDVVDALVEDDLARFFSHVFLRAGREALFQDCEPVERLLEQLAQLGYEPLGAADSIDPDLPGFHLWRNPAALKLIVLRNELGARQAELVQLKSSLETRISELGNEVISAQDEIATLRNAAEQLATDSASSLAAREQRIAELESDLTVGAQRVSELEGDLTARGQRIAELEGDLTARGQRIAELDALLAARDQRIAGLQSELGSEVAALAESREDADRRVAEATAETERVKGDLSVSLRLQALREADLKELQQRYAKANATREEQHQLLLALKERLATAAYHLQQLEREGTTLPAGRVSRKASPDKRLKRRKKKRG